MLPAAPTVWNKAIGTYLSEENPTLPVAKKAILRYFENVRNVCGSKVENERVRADYTNRRMCIEITFNFQDRRYYSKYCINDLTVLWMLVSISSIEIDRVHAENYDRSMKGI